MVPPPCCARSRLACVSAERAHGREKVGPRGKEKVPCGSVCVHTRVCVLVHACQVIFETELSGCRQNWKGGCAPWAPGRDPGLP